MSFFRCLIVSFVLLCSASVFAESVEPWQFTVTPVLWNASVVANLPGSGNGGGQPIKPDYNFFSLDNLTDYLSLQFEAKHGRFSLLFDSLRARYEDELSAGPVDFNVSSELGFVELAVAYQVSQQHKVDLIAGVRQSFLDMSANISVDKIDLIPDLERENSSQWTDPVVGLRYNYSMTNNWQLWLRGDVGVFSVDTKRNINALANVQYIFNQYVSAIVGYRYFKIDFKQGDILKDVELKGVYLGVGIHF